MYGVKKLTDIELLAIFLRSGSKKEDVLTLSKRIIAKYGNLNNLKYISIKEYMDIPGIGGVKSIELISLFEFSNRINARELEVISSVKDASSIAFSLIGNDLFESFLVIFLDRRNKIIYKEILYRGTENELIIEPKEVIALALKKNASKFYCFHNHPSGDLSASNADRLITNRLLHYSNLFSIKLLAHVIINKNRGFKSIT